MMIYLIGKCNGKYTFKIYIEINCDGDGVT